MKLAKMSIIKKAIQKLLPLQAGYVVGTWADPSNRSGAINYEPRHIIKTGI